jgi:hypothetical protein
MGDPVGGFGAITVTSGNDAVAASVVSAACPWPAVIALHKSDAI